ncbi:MAG: pyridoxal-dependent decarboxylase [Melioribacteraceae bacterium]|nr:pyridoxal-dependent decarboxylase [Melioribacteraceae bacterium]
MSKIKSKILGDMPSEEFKKYGYQLIDWISDYFDNIETNPVLAQVKPGDIKSQLPKEAPTNNESFDEMINDLNRIIMPGITHWNHPNFMAYFNSTSSGPGILGELLAAAINANGMVWKSNPSGTELEETVLNWFRDMIGLPQNYFGVVYDTASVSSMHAIAAAREHTGLDIRSKGLSGLPKLILYCTEHSHSSIDKGALTLGIGLDGIRKIPTDENFAMIPEKLADAIKGDRAKGSVPFCVVATIGTTSSTAVDPVEEIAKICEREKTWLHVDSAYAGVTAMLPEMKSYFKGMERADSIVINPHKWLFVPVDFSILYTRKPEILKRAFSLTPEYLKTTEETAINYMDYGIQLGRRFRSLKFWFVLRYFGVEGLKEILREHLRLTNLFATWIDGSPLFERLAPVYFGTVCFRAKPPGIADDEELNRLNEKLLNMINETGKVFLVHTKLNGKFTIRVVISGLRMEEKHVELAWNIINSEVKKLISS